VDIMSFLKYDGNNGNDGWHGQQVNNANNEGLVEFERQLEEGTSSYASPPQMPTLPMLSNGETKPASAAVQASNWQNNLDENET